MSGGVGETKGWLEREERVWDINAVVALSPLVIAAILLLISLASELSYDDLRKAHPQYSRALRLVDTIEKVTPKLEVAASDLRDYEIPGGDSDTLHPANPRHASVNVGRAARVLHTVLRDWPELEALHRELVFLQKRLKTVDVLRGEGGYRPLRLRIEQVSSTFEWKIGELVKSMPQRMVGERTRLRNWSRISFRWAIVSALLGLVFGIAWISDLKERMQVQRLRQLLRRRREEAANPAPDDRL
jgi:hypothetical protein